MRFEVYYSHPEGLIQRVYVFWYNPDKHCLVLDEYRKEERQTRRHKFVPVDVYYRLSKRDSNLTVDEIDISAILDSDIRYEFNKNLTVVKQLAP